MRSEHTLAALAAQRWDLLVIGGGITGAGIALEAARAGYRVLLVEQRDFAWGTSSRSSKLIHGGLRYLKQGKFGLTREAVREREQLLRQAPGLVEPQSFALADYAGRKPGRWIYALGLAVYNRMAGQRGKGYLGAGDFLMLAPHIAREALKGGLTYDDAKTDDARLVLRVLQEARSLGASALNYVAAQNLSGQGGVAAEAGAPAGTPTASAELVCALTGARHRVRAHAIVNATGAWADGLRRPEHIRPMRRLRPLRGSHLIFAAWRLPVAQAVSLMHPRDGRPVFAYPWEGVTLVGTTDIDHREGLRDEAAITPEEVAYLMEALDLQFPQLALGLDDIVSTYAGVRPVIDCGSDDPSSEGRDHAVWMEDGMLTVTGGKLTTFRPIARDALRALAPVLPAPESPRRGQSGIFWQHAPLSAASGLNLRQRTRLLGRYGGLAHAVVACAREAVCGCGSELETVPGTDTLWAQLRFAARSEAVAKLEDLMLRRTRLGLLLRDGGAAVLPRVRAICQAELGWDDARWDCEERAYLALWRRHYSLPEHGQVPAWRASRAA